MNIEIESKPPPAFGNLEIMVLFAVGMFWYAISFAQPEEFFWYMLIFSALVIVTSSIVVRRISSNIVVVCVSGLLGGIIAGLLLHFFWLNLLSEIPVKAHPPKISPLEGFVILAVIYGGTGLFCSLVTRWLIVAASGDVTPNSES